VNGTAYSRGGWITGRLALLVVVAAMYVPVAMTFAYSFNASRVGTVWTGFSTRGYTELWRERGLWEGLRASLLIGTATSTLSVAAATLAALGLARWRLKSRAAARGLLALPLVTPDIILAISLAIFFHALSVEKGYGTVVLAHGVFGIAYAYVVMASAVGDLDGLLYAAALDCGATPWQAFWRVTAPLLAPSLAVAWLFVFALSFDDFLITFLTKGPGADTLPIKIYGQLRFGVKPQTSALFVVLFFLTLLMATFAWRLNRRQPGARDA
jgi:ABC-type spermidine/putrescine transport system permease subunit II